MPLSLRQQLRQTQTLTPQMKQALAILQAPLADLRQLIRQSAPYRIYRNRGDCRAAAGERIELLESIRNGDTERAAKLLAAHIDRGADDLARAAAEPNER